MKGECSRSELRVEEWSGVRCGSEYVGKRVVPVRHRIAVTDIHFGCVYPSLLFYSKVKNIVVPAFSTILL